MARQFNMIPPVCEQAEYHLFQREKVEVQLPELYHKIGKCQPVKRLRMFSHSPSPLPPSNTLPTKRALTVVLATVFSVKIAVGLSVFKKGRVHIKKHNIKCARFSHYGAFSSVVPGQVDGVSVCLSPVCVMWGYRCGGYDLVTTGLWHHHWEVREWNPRNLQGLHEGMTECLSGSLLFCFADITWCLSALAAYFSETADQLHCEYGPGTGLILSTSTV